MLICRVELLFYQRVNMINCIPETQGCSHPRYIQMQGGLNILHPLRHSEGVTIVNHYQS